jgi:DNA segregation ATPase FtsK/SpoIIIE-like protein
MIVGLMMMLLLFWEGRAKTIFLGVFGFTGWVLPPLLIIFPILRLAGYEPTRLSIWRNLSLAGLFGAAMTVSSVQGVLRGHCDSGGLVGIFFPSYFRQFLGRGGYVVSLLLGLLLLWLVLIQPLLRTNGITLPGLGDLLRRFRSPSLGEGAPVDVAEVPSVPGRLAKPKTSAVLGDPTDAEASYGMLPQPINDQPLSQLLIPPAPPESAQPVAPEELDRLSSVIHATVKKLIRLELEPAGVPVVGMTSIRFPLAKAPGQTVSVSRVDDIAGDLGLETGRAPVRVIVDNHILIELPLTEEERRFAPIGPLLRESPPVLPGHGIRYLIGRTQGGGVYELAAGSALHMLVGGESGGGKSVLLHSIIWGLIFRYPPSKVRLALYDHKMEEFSAYAGLPHLWQEIVTGERGCARMLSNLRGEITRRKLARRDNPDAEFPWIVVVMDEFRGIDDDALVELVAESRSLGIRFILGTQRAEAGSVSTSIKANLATGISFHVRNQSESRLIIGVPDACNLLPHGDCIVHPPSGLDRVQAGWVRPADLKALRDYLKIA